MPIKFKQSVKARDRTTGKMSIQHYYMKCMSQPELFKELNNQKTKPKLKQKIRNEIVRRGVSIEWVPKEAVNE